MKKVLICLCLAVAAVFVSPKAVSYEEQSLLSPRVFTQTQNDLQIPSIVTEGFEAFKSGDVQVALSIWLRRSSPFLRNSAPLISSALQEVVKEAVGKCIGYSAIDSLSVTDNTQVVYVESQHEYGALFWAFTTYKSPSGWIISNLSFNASPNEIIPIPILFSE